MKLDLWKWEMLLQGREFRNKTNDNWQKINGLVRFYFNRFKRDLCLCK